MKWRNALFLLMLWSGIACQQSENNTTFVREVVSVERFVALMETYLDAQILDVRTPEEFAAGHIEGAENRNYYDDDFEEQLKKLDKNKTVLVYCKSGGRSGKASAQLQALEFHKVYDLEGGYTAWAAKK